MKRKMEKERLLRLADYVETIPRRLWDMDVYLKKADMLPCKTVGCLAGHAGVSGQIYGFEFREGSRWDMISGKSGEPVDIDDAFRESFGLTNEQTIRLTIPEEYIEEYGEEDEWDDNLVVTQQMVSLRIREMVASG